MKNALNDNNKKLFNNNDYMPKRFGLNYNPPQISKFENHFQFQNI